ncbi:MAG: T9SS type A sorting domain-containing protein, partial [FCB group bacterium]|nr:T9SS type A sorting domain-containing protein [FCB group bacterium]
FLRYLIINKGNHLLDSVFIASWNDPDIGDANDDLNGSDSALGLAYTYNDSNGDVWYGSIVPAVGTIVLQGPMVYSPGDTAFMFGRSVPDYRNLPMTSFSKSYKAGAWGDPHSATAVFNAAQGLTHESYWNEKAGDPMINPVTGRVTKWAFTGKPWLNEGWLCEWPADLRHIPGTGPFTLVPGDSQEVVIALILSSGANATLAVPALMADVEWVRSTWKSGFVRRGAVATVREEALPVNSEDTGPFILQFRIQPNPGWELSAEQPQLYYQVREKIDSVSMVPVGMDRWLAIVPSFPEIVSTAEFRYWIRLTSSDGVSMSWPSGSPPNYAGFLFGPDTVVPVITGLPQLTNVHFLLPFARKVTVEVFDDRHGYYPPELHWQVGTQPVRTIRMIPDTTWYSYKDPKVEWTGVLKGEPEVVGDTIRYWVTARDSSRSRNIGRSTRNYFLAQTFEAIGDWENEKLKEWDLFTRGYLTTFNMDTFNIHWNKVVMTYAGDEADTMTYRRPLDLTRFNRGWITFNMMFLSSSPENRGWIEVSDDSLNWVALDSFINQDARGIISPRYTLDDFLQRSNVYVRFRIAPENGAISLVLDDVFLHSDSISIPRPEPPAPPLPERVRLHQNYPNPFNPMTTIRYELPEATPVRLAVYDLLGREVAVLVDQQQEPGIKEVVWNASQMASGIYFYRLTTDQVQITRKMVVLK